MRTLALALLVGTAGLPAVAMADAPFSACVNAFTKSIAGDDAPAPTFKVVHRAEHTGSVLEYFATATTFDLVARNPKTGEVHARATCVADNRGRVSSLERLPLDKPVTSLAKR